MREIVDRDFERADMTAGVSDLALRHGKIRPSRRRDGRGRLDQHGDVQMVLEQMAGFDGGLVAAADEDDAAALQADQRHRRRRARLPPRAAPPSSVPPGLLHWTIRRTRGCQRIESELRVHFPRPLRKTAPSAACMRPSAACLPPRSCGTDRVRRGTTGSRSQVRRGTRERSRHYRAASCRRTSRSEHACWNQPLLSQFLVASTPASSCGCDWPEFRANVYIDGIRAAMPEVVNEAAADDPARCFGFVHF